MLLSGRSGLTAHAAATAHAASLGVFCNECTGHDYASQRNDPGFPE
ncbi:hypothetical protein PAMC26577_36780 [Caballeronia sordidicola]|uniref:Uncharacterized protein n=1 Tax=Caballeronia sordidicola TaxID=196367 RepID=A0A242M862_CABSO|nr:hypothetical protein PAMC26577_36780 [Caballeronia sordidicola]